MEITEALTAGLPPLGIPVYPLRPTLFTNREYFSVTYRTDRDAAKAVVPAPLIVDDPLVRFEVMKMGDVEGFGPYLEAGQLVQVSLDGEDGEYSRVMYLNNVPALISGREISAYPKLHGDPALVLDEGALVGTFNRGRQRVATATMPYKWQPLDHGEALKQVTTPAFAVKAVLDIFKTIPLQVALARLQIKEVEVVEAWTGPARLQLFEHAMAPMADLPVHEIVSASHIVTNLRLEPAALAHDYLAAAQ